MKKDIVLGTVLVIFIVAVFSVVLGNLESTVQPTPVPVVENKAEEKTEETIEEQMARWDRGEFTEEEIAEIRTEEEREDAALETMFE